MQSVFYLYFMLINRLTMYGKNLVEKNGMWRSITGTGVAIAAYLQYHWILSGLDLVFNTLI